MKKLNKLFAILVSLAMMATLCVSMSLAKTAQEAGDNKATTLAGAVITKQLDLADGVSAAGATLTFNFAPVNEEATVENAETTAANTPAVSKGNTITITAGDTGTNGQKIYTLPLSEIFSIGKTAVADKASLTTAGVYIYDVTETGELTSHDQDSTTKKTTVNGNTKTEETLKNSQAKYRVRIYVKNNADKSDVELEAVTVEPLIKDDGSQVTGTDAGSKVKPSAPTEGDETSGGFRYVNNYTKKVTKTPSIPTAEDGFLNVKKTVSGSLASTTQAFPFTMTINYPSNYEFAENETLVAKKYNGSAAATGDDVAFTINTTTKTATAEFTLSDGQILKFDTLPAGTTYTVEEQLQTKANTVNNAGKYTPTVEIAGAANGAVAPSNANAGVDLSNADKAVLLSETETNATRYTNTYATTTPEGILISNLPYIALALVAIGGLVAYVVIRRRNADEA